MIFWENFHFLRPWWLLALIIPFAAYRYFFASMKNVSAWEAVCDKRLLDFLLVRGNSKQRSFMGITAIIGLCGAILALSGPSWQKKNVPAFSPVNPLMILLNLSSDMENEDVTPDRLTRAKFAIDDLLKNIKGQVGLIVYSNEPYLITPMTEDRQVISNLLPAIGTNIMPENGDKLNRALDLAVEKLKADGYNQGNIVIFAADIGQEFNASLDAAAKAANAGYRVNVVGVRTDNNEKLELLATRGKGMYLGVSGGMSALSSDINSEISEDLQESENEREIWEDGGYWLLFIPLICSLYFFRRGILAITIFLAMTATAEAGFFTNNNQDAARAFENQDYATAAENFNLPRWKAAALYRNGDFAEALKFFGQSNEVEDLYNQGNALAKSGKTDEAIKKYEEVLKVAPEHEDAAFNLEYLKQQEKEQQQSQSQKNNQEQQNQNKDNQPQGGNGEQEGGDSSQSDAEESAGEQKQQADNQPQNEGGGGKSQQSEQNSEQNDKNNPSNDNSAQSTQQNSGDDERQAPSYAEQDIPAGSESDKQSDEEASGIGGETEEEGDFDEEVQAREMVYRNIPEDAGGLLRAFIRKEYNKNRYGDNYENR